MRLPSALLVLAALATAASAQSPSFDCKQAHTRREQVICSSDDLAALDVKLNREYKTLHSSLSSENAAAVQNDQRSWLHAIDQRCTAKDDETYRSCLQDTYNTRRSQLSSGLTLDDGHVLFQRDTYTTTPPPQGAPHKGSRRPPNMWLEIDNPTPAERAWNKYFLAKHADFASPRSHRESYYDPSFGATAANHHVISVGFDGCDDVGGAHPWCYVLYDSYSLDLGRSLTISDILLPSSGWKTGLIPVIEHKLSTGENAENISTGKELHDGIAEGLAGPSPWTIDSQGLTFTFERYRVGNYVAGMPSATVTWQELRPYLNPAFHPEILPNPRPTPPADEAP